MTSWVPRRRRPRWELGGVLLLSLGVAAVRSASPFSSPAAAAMAGPPLADVTKASSPSSSKKDIWSSVPLGSIHSRLSEMRLSEAEMQDLQDFMAQRSRSASLGSFDMDAELGAFTEQRRALARARELRKEGNDLMGVDDVEGARRKYSDALEMIQSHAEVQTRRMKQAGHSCLLSIAVCDMRQGDNEAAQLVCTAILEDEPSARVRVMTLTRRARALLREDDLDRAIDDLSEANRLDPSNGEIADELRDLGGEPVVPPQKGRMPPPAPPSPFGFPGNPLLPGPEDSSLGGGGGMQSLLGGLAGLSGGPAGSGGLGGGGGGMDAMLKNVAGQMGPKLLAMVEKPETLSMLCSMVNTLDARAIMNLSRQFTGAPMSEAYAEAIARKTTTVTPQSVQKYIKWGKRVMATYRVSNRVAARSKPWVRRTRTVLPYVLLLRWIAACL